MNHHVIALSGCETVDKRLAIPRHYQINQILRKAMRGARKGDRLPSEKEMAKTFQVALLTVRRALEDLVKKGIIEKKWGRGIYVKKPLPPEKNIGGRIGMTVLRGLINHPATIEIVRGISETLDQYGYRLELVVISPAMIRSGDYSGIKRSGDLSGLIIALQEIPGKNLANICRQAPHSVLYNRFDHENTVMFDFRSAASLLTQHLLDLGHRRITLLNGPDCSEISRAVSEGYLEAMNAAHISKRELRIKYGSYTSSDGSRLAKTVCGLKDPPTALITGDDFMALGALEALRELGLRCPEDVSVASFNNFPFTGATRPPLTTVHVPFYNLGRAMAVRILDLIKGRQIFRKEVIKGRLIIRQSTGECNAKSDYRRRFRWNIRERKTASGI